MEFKLLVLARGLLILYGVQAQSERLDKMTQFESPVGKVVEVKSQEELASLVAGLNWSGNNTIYVMMPTISQDNFTSPMNRSTNPQTDEIPGRNLTAEESLIGDDKWTGPIVALRSSKNGKYVRVSFDDD
jgi:hypothetical protein